jgi:DNA-binding MarR family transcriptional regulator
MVDFNHETKRGRLFMPPSGDRFILALIAARDAPVRPGEISALCGVTSARVAMALKTLESKDFIRREPDQTDRRKTLVTLTERGRAVFQRKNEQHRKTVERVLRELGEDDAREFVRITGKMLDISRTIFDENGESWFND